MPVMQVSSSENSVGRLAAQGFTSSRLRRVLAGRSRGRPHAAPHAADMGQLAALGVFGVLQQGGGGGVGVVQVLRAPGLQAGCAQVFEQLALAQGTVKLPVGRGWRGPLPFWRSTAVVARKRSATPAL